MLNVLGFGLGMGVWGSRFTMWGFGFAWFMGPSNYV